MDGDVVVDLNDELANDRTYLAWLRTGIALFAFGFVVAKVAYLIHSDPKGLSQRDFYTILGVLLVPMLYVMVGRLSGSKPGKPPAGAPAAGGEAAAHGGGH